MVGNCQLQNPTNQIKSVNCVRTIWSITLIRVQIENFTNPTETRQHEYMNMMCVSDRYKRDI